MSKRIDKPAADETAADDVAIVFTLSKPIIAYGDEVKVLRLRKPTGADLLRVGNPVKFSPFTSPPTVEHDYAKVIAMAARLANVPSSSLEKLEPEELTSLAWELSPFFIPTR
jgi:hypothetical protein